MSCHVNKLGQRKQYSVYTVQYCTVPVWHCVYLVITVSYNIENFGLGTLVTRLALSKQMARPKYFTKTWF